MGRRSQYTAWYTASSLQAFLGLPCSNCTKSQRECKAGSFFLFRPGIKSKTSKTSKTRDKSRRNRNATLTLAETNSDTVKTSLPSDTDSHPVSTSSGVSRALALIQEQTSLPNSIDNDQTYQNPINNPLSINEFLCSETDGTLPSGDCTTPPFIVKPGSLYVDRPVAQAIDYRAAELLLHFKTVIAKPWFEVTDPGFTNEALRRAPRCPLLLYSLLAVSSSHKSRFLDDPDIAQDYARYGEEYHEKCISLLLPMLNDSESITDGAFLACSTILRWYEELSAPIHGRDDARHLLGGYASVTESFEQDLTWEGFRGAALWIHLRQDIFNAVINQRVPRTNVKELEIDRSSSPADETIWAKRVLCLEAEVVEYCLGGEGSSIQQYKALEARLEDWDSQKPQTFTPVLYQERDPSQGVSFPVVSVLLDSCVFGLSHYYFAMLMMLVHDPRMPKVGTQYLECQKEIRIRILHFLRLLCGLASSSPVPPARGMTCLALSLFGSWITDHAERDAAINVLRKVDREDAWPTSSLQRDLQAQWENRD
ncbi:related to ARCA protein [Fusarium fujikuroi IMI 58289]|uniref:Related to ARCA protein n=1 Tax=Gibberella fujikuroi (strain CBS 195.34 / IMI 58289 / NRRL A-6831) TaxID=1279085 RepID=S0EP64_GIBF5|nr:related to ARCA protein [Fusarium fujikuroi IMI 58289]CCT74693.1 related to ARCA protein [Fusarium fujikuroi IMI 58289]SCO05058.1 related to ARCA protein [Fusarium fujikuroi]SCO57971.1 related to ARCA protein [Fusarium fujikuroi]